VNTGLNGEFHLALHEVASHVTTVDIALLGTPHLMSCMQTLNLDHNLIGDAGATALAASLKGNWMLKRLSLKHNRIAREGGNEIGLALQENTVLQELYLNLNVLSDDGIVHLSHALGTSACNLKVLDLEGNQLSYVASRLLAHALAEAKNLDTLLLRNNLVGGDGAGLLEQGLRHSSSVTYLDLERNVLGDIGMRCLMRAMRRIPPRRGRKAQPDNRSIRKLNVCCNNITDACIEEVAEALHKNITLRTIMTDQNEISEEGRKKIDSMLAANVRRADLEKRAIKIQCLFRGRMERLARAKEGGELMQAHETRAPKEGDLVKINLLQGNLKRYNGREGRIISMDFDEEHRQWFSVKLDDNIRVLPIRCPKKSVTIVKKDQNELETEYIEKPDELVGDAVASQSQMLAIADDASGALPKSEEGASLVPIPDDTPRSGGSEISKVSGMSDLAREGSELLSKLPGQQSNDLISHVLQAESPVAAALLRKLALQEWPGHHPSTAGSENNTTAPSAGELERPKTYGGKSVKERDLMMTAAKLTVLNMGDALMQQQAAAEEMAREAGRKCLEAAEHYAELEAHLKAVIVDEDTSEEDVKIALQALTDAEQEAVRMMQEADEAEEAARRAFLAMSNFERFEQEEAALEKAISGLDPGDDSDWENQLTNRRSMSSIDEVGPGENEFSGSQGVQSHKSSARSGETKITPERTSKWAGADAKSALEKTATAGASVSAYYKHLRQMLEDENATVEGVEAAVAEFNRTQDAALATFASAVKALEDEALSLQVYHEGSEILVNGMRQEMADAFARLQALQDADAGEEEFAEALSDFSMKNAQISQLVVRAEIFRLGSSWSESSSRREALSPGRNELVELVAKEHLSSLLERAHMESVKHLGEAEEREAKEREAEEEKGSVEGEQYYTSKEEAAAMLIQTIARGNAVRSKSTRPNKKTLTAEMKAMFEKKYSNEQMQAILKIQGLARGDRDRRLVRRKKRLGQVAVQQDYLNFIKSRTPEERERLDKEATKIQARFRSGNVRTSLITLKMGQELGIERAADIFEQVTGTDMTGSDAIARFNRQQLAERLAKNQKSLDSFYNHDTAKRELAAVIVQEGVREMQTRGRMSQFNTEPTEVEEQHLRSMMDTSGMMIHHTTKNQTEQAGERRRAQKSKTGGSLSDMKAMGTQVINSSLLESPEEEDSNYLSMLKNTKSSMRFQGQDSPQSRSQFGSQHDVGGAEGALERGLFSLDRVLGMSTEEKTRREAEKEAATLLGNIRHQALAEMEEDLADEAGLLQNVVYEGMMEEIGLDRPPESHQSGGVSFFNLKEYRAMKGRKEVVDLLGKSNTHLILNMCGHHLANLDGAWGLSDPYLKFCRINEDGSRSEVRRTTVIDDNLDPQWPTVKLSLKALCRNDSNATFRIECWDSDASFADPLHTINDDLIGYIDTTVEELKKRRNEYIPLLTPSPEYLQIAIHSQLIRQGVDKATAASQALAAASAKAADLMRLGAGLKAGGAAAAGLKKGMSLGLHGASIVQGLGKASAGAMSKVGLGALGAGMSKVTNLGADAMAKGMGLVHSLEAKGMEGANMLKDVGTGALSTAANLGQKVSEAVSGLEQQHEGEGPADYGPGFISVAKICQLQGGELIFEADYVQGHVPSLLQAKLSDNGTSAETASTSAHTTLSAKEASTSAQATDRARTSAQVTLSAKEELERFFSKTRQKALELVSTHRPGKNAVDQRLKAKNQSPLSKVVNVRQAIPSSLDESSPQAGITQCPVLLNDSGLHGVATIPEEHSDSEAPVMTGASQDVPHRIMPHIHLPHMPHMPHMPHIPMDSSLRIIHDMFSDDMVLNDNTVATP
jgi:Ran GTPase-activating protein (RanGAP) involved in mRNA processing and transport